MHSEAAALLLRLRGIRVQISVDSEGLDGGALLLMLLLAAQKVWCARARTRAAASNSKIREVTAEAFSNFFRSNAISTKEIRNGLNYVFYTKFVFKQNVNPFIYLTIK